MIIKLIKKVIPILLIILLCMMLPIEYINIFFSKVEAREERPEDNERETNGQTNIEVTLETAREQIASYAEGFATSPNGGLCRYDYNKRGRTYEGLLPNSSDPYYWFDCVGWVNFAINRSIGIDFGPCHIGAAEGGGGFVTPSGVKDTSHFASINISSARRGDILIAPAAPHVAIYLGNGKVVDMWDTSTGLSVRGLSGFTMTGWTACTFSEAATLVSIDGVNFGEIPDGTDFTFQYPEGITEAEVDLDEIIDEMKFDGMPPDVTYGGTHSIQYYLEKVSDTFDYVIGIMFNGIKVVSVSILEGIQGIITGVLDFVCGNNRTT